ncbi:MAG: hypothetical protein P1S60_17900, partial [Anaerolineae bacterium]|nr:hypothetical protein [Anaerolineae bacterium]
KASYCGMRDFDACIAYAVPKHTRIGAIVPAFHAALSMRRDRASESVALQKESTQNARSG